MEMHTSSTPAPTGPRASQLGTTASLLRPGGAVTVSAASDGGRAPVVLAAGADPALADASGRIAAEVARAQGNDMVTKRLASPAAREAAPKRP